MTSGGTWLLRDVTRGSVVADRVAVASTLAGRFRGLMGRSTLQPGEGLYLPTSSIHMFFMRFPIDALFVGRADADGVREVVGVRGGLPPWRGVALPVAGAEGVVELAAGTLADGPLVGDCVRLEPAVASCPIVRSAAVRSAA
ncbi:hypothetical protein BH18CHL1_BH18CHL1_09960 [soil metagenome]